MDPKPEGTTESLGNLASGQEVIDRHRSHLDDVTSQILPEALSKISLEKGIAFTEQTVDMERDIAGSKVVETTTEDNENIYFAIREGRFQYSRFVKGREPLMSRHMTVVLKQDSGDINKYVLITAYVGGKAGLEPYDKRAQESDMEYWRTHAFVSELVAVIPGTETKEVPEYFQK
ncbi:MAG: hypothetical protein AB9915_00505 [Candidatus Dojkabacteria bacterium]